LEIIEDACQSLGTTYKKKQSGTFSKMGCFSMYAAKVITAGEGGAVVTDDKNLFEKLRKIRNHGMLHGYDTRILGLNLRLPEICAALAKVQMTKLTKFLEKRKKNATILSELLSDLNIILPEERNGVNVNWYLYTIATKNRNKLMKQLNSQGIGATAYYSIPVHKTPFYKKSLKLPLTDWAANSVLSLPVNPLVTENDLHYISKVLHKLIA
ncbi:MAG: DegT/DnrJ/EryC1/StrS family aminotransferase, partial [Nitrosotalea sp.]